MNKFPENKKELIQILKDTFADTKRDHDERVREAHLDFAEKMEHLARVAESMGIDWDEITKD